MTNDQIEKIAYQSIANNFICILTLNEVDTDGKNLQTKQKIKSINYPYIVTDQNYYLINDIYSLQTI